MMRQTWDSAKISVPVVAKFVLNDLGETGAAGVRIQEGKASSIDYLVAAGAIPGVKVESKAAQVVAEGVLDPAVIRFTQSSIKNFFRDGRAIDVMADALKSGKLKPGNVSPIRVFENDGKIFTLDNRRLEAFRRAGVDVPYIYAKPGEVAREAWKFTTKNDGISVRIRGN